MTRSLLLAAALLASPAALAGKKDKGKEAEAATTAAAPAAPAAPAAAPAAEVPAGAQAAYDYRHAAFEALGYHMKSLGLFVKGRLEPRTEHLVAHARSMHELSLVIPHFFPAGTGPDVVPETEALPAIWADPQGFAARSQELQTQASALLDLASGGDMDAFKAQYGKVGAACGACHDAFRKDDE